MKYFVVGYEDTRGEFSPEGVTKSLKKATAFKKKLKDKLYSNSRVWVAVHAVDEIK